MPPPFRFPVLVSCGTGLAAFALHAATASRSITWWEGSSYPLAAYTLGIAPAPGSLLMTLLGWALSRVSIVQPVAFQLNLVAALVISLAVACVTWIAIRLATPDDRPPGVAETMGGVIAGSVFAVGLTPWTFAVQFTPYGLTASFTALILIVALDWWRSATDSDQHGRLFLLFLLFGLDFSVHRTNSLMLPAALIWVFLRRPDIWRRPLTWGAPIAGLALGLAFHLLLIPLAARDPALNSEDPSNLARFWSYVSMEGKGGGFLIHLFPRNADFWRVQLGDCLGFLGRNLWAPAAWPWLMPAALLGILGWGAALRTEPRRTLGLLAFFLCASLGAVLYFNVPEGYFRSLDRHYLPSLVVWAALIGVGAGALLRLSSRVSPRARPLVVIILGAVVMIGPIGGWVRNRSACDLSRTRFAETFARDLLEPLPEHAILVTQGDNDTFPLWYLQHVERIRNDVSVVNVSTANADWYAARLHRQGLLSRRFPREELFTLVEMDSTITVAVDARARADLPPAMALPETAGLRVTGSLFGGDRVALDLLRINGWRRPLNVACTVDRQNMPWIWPYARLNGLSYLIVPSSDPSVWDVDRLRRQLMERTRYPDFADTTRILDADTVAMLRNYFAALIQLAQAQLERGDPAACLETLSFMAQRAPPTRLGIDPALLEPLRDRAESDLARVR